MSSRNLSRIIAACLLAAVLAVPATAQSRRTGVQGTAHAWQWLTSLWQRGVATVTTWTADLQKVGPGIDPNGGTTGGSPGPTTQSDIGPGIDPNGVPKG